MIYTIIMLDTLGRKRNTIQIQMKEIYNARKKNEAYTYLVINIQ